ncbi:MAG: TIM barrel protein [Roseiflexaceae bacterium]
MTPLRIANAPCSWGTLEFAGLSGERITYTQMLDELVATGYSGTELGDWGFMPTNPRQLADELARRQLTLIGAFMPVALQGDTTQITTATTHAQRTAELLTHTAHILGQTHAPLLILADANGTDPVRTANAGRITGRTPSGVIVRAANVASEVARAIYAASGLQSAFHHHCAGIIETPDEVRRFLMHSDNHVLGLVFDTGHMLYGSGDNTTDIAALLHEFAPRVRLVHFKDCHPEIATRTRHEQLDYFAAIQAGIFCELGKGAVQFTAIRDTLHQIGYSGWIVVEQDVLPGMGAPRLSADANRVYLRSIGL